MNLTVNDLRKSLAGLPDDMPVIIAKDRADNAYSPLSRVVDGNSYAADSSYSGSVGFTKLTEDHRKAGYDEMDVVNGTPCVMLCPVH